MSLKQFSVAEVSATAKAGIRYPQLDALRGLAIAFVFLCHLYPNRLPGGYVGVDLFFVLDVPHLGFDPKSCKALRPVLGDAKRQSACHQSRQDLDQRFVSSRQAHIIEALKEFPEVLVVNAADAVCDQSRCYGMKDGALLYSDSNHLPVAGSVLVGRLIAERMRSAQIIGH